MSSLLVCAAADAQVRSVVRRVYKGAPEAGYVPTPHGWAHESCVYLAAPNALVQRSASGSFSVTRTDGARTSVAPCRYRPIAGTGARVVGVTRSTGFGQPPPPTVNGWELASSAYADLDTYFTQIHTSWTVPQPPARGGALLYFFNGLQPEDGTTVIQPVLQYGVSPAGGGSYWSATSWLVSVADDGTQTVFIGDALTTLGAGEQLTGHVTSSNCTSEGSCTWAMWLDGPRGTFGRLTVPNVAPVMAWAFRAVAEFYAVDTCDQVPASRSITFRDNRIFDASHREIDAALTWSPLKWTVTPDCGNAVENFAGGARLTF